jgi:hypothetical protein
MFGAVDCPLISGANAHSTNPTAIPDTMTSIAVLVMTMPRLAGWQFEQALKLD